MKYICWLNIYKKSVLWRVAKRLSYKEDARCLKVKLHYKNKHFYHIECIKLPRVPVHCKTAKRASLILWVMVTELLLINFPAIMRPGPEAEQSPPYGVEVKNEKVYTFTFTQHACFLTLNSDNFTFTLNMELSYCKVRLHKNLINLNFAGWIHNMFKTIKKVPNFMFRWRCILVQGVSNMTGTVCTCLQV